MELKRAIEILKSHNKWRRYNGDLDKSPEQTSPILLGIAIDKVVTDYNHTKIHRANWCREDNEEHTTESNYKIKNNGHN